MINNEITAEKVRLITEGNNEVMDLSKALALAEKEKKDLVCISDGDIPAVKIMDYAKYLYEKKKRQKQNKKNQHIVKTKEIKFNESTEINDLKTKAKQIDKFLSQGNKVKIYIVYHGRMIGQINNGKEKMQNIFDLLKSEYTIESNTTIVSNTVVATLMGKLVEK